MALACAAAGIFLSGCAPGGKQVENNGVKPVEERRVKSGEKVDYSLTAGEKRTLLRIARDTVEKYVREGRAADLAEYPVTERLKEERGAFVTLTNPEPSSPVAPQPLRGCIGNFTPKGPLAETVRDMAVSACSRDTRFPPVMEKELDDLEIEISALSPLLPSDDPLSIEKGVHGIYIKVRQGFGGGTYLPQVWSEHFPGQDAEYFWNHLCRYKAGLPADAWRHPDKYEVLVYTADVFSEKNL